MGRKLTKIILLNGLPYCVANKKGGGVQFQKQIRPATWYLNIEDKTIDNIWINLSNIEKQKSWPEKMDMWTWSEKNIKGYFMSLDERGTWVNNELDYIRLIFEFG